MNFTKYYFNLGYNLQKEALLKKDVTLQPHHRSNKSLRIHTAIEKIAAQSSDADESVGSYAVGALGGAVATNLAASPLIKFITADEERLTDRDRRKLFRYVKSTSGIKDLKHTIPTPLQEAIHGKTMSQYFPTHKAVVTPKKVDVGVLAHELGHARHMSSPKRLIKTSPMTHMRIRSGSPLVGLVGGGFAAASENKDVRDWAPAIASAGHLPTLYQEGRATAHGLRDIKRVFGKKEMYKRVPRLLGAFGTYASLPIGTYFGAKGLMNLMED